MMIARLNRLAKHIEPGTCPACGLPLRGPVARIVRLQEGDPEFKSCRTCNSPTVLVLRTRVVTAR